MQRKWPAMVVVVLGLVSVAWQQALGQITQAELRSYTEHALKEGYVQSELPTFSWNDHGVKYNLGGVPIDPRPVVSAPSPKDELLAFPLREQYIATGIRLHRTTRQQRSFWNPVLERIEVEIGKMLRIIASKDQSHAVLRGQLEEAQKQIHSIYFDALNALAQKDGGTAAEIRPCKAKVITLSVDPVNGQLHYITAGDLSFYQYFKGKKGIQEPSWQILPTGNCVSLYGKNWISAQWPNSKPWVNLVDIGAANSVTVTPHGVDLRR